MLRLIRKSQGFTLLEALIVALLLAIAAALISGALSASTAAAAKVCEIKLIAITTVEQQWNASKAGTTPNVALCEQVNALVKGYNAACSAYGALPTIPCK